MVAGFRSLLLRVRQRGGGNSRDGVATKHIHGEGARRTPCVVRGSGISPDDRGRQAATLRRACPRRPFARGFDRPPSNPGRPMGCPTRGKTTQRRRVPDRVIASSTVRPRHLGSASGGVDRTRACYRGTGNGRQDDARIFPLLQRDAAGIHALDVAPAKYRSGIVTLPAHRGSARAHRMGRAGSCGHPGPPI